MENKPSLALVNLTGARILITGASGWLGREALCSLDQYFPTCELNLTLASSTAKQVQIHGFTYETIPISAIRTNEEFDLILHFAFSTQDKAAIQGVPSYIRSNLDLNQWISNLKNNNPDAKTLILSSGAVEKYNNPAALESPMTVYADLKKDLEKRFTDTNSLILRLWNTSGHHMNADPKYALGEFVRKAALGEPITVSKNLKRSYAGASCVIEASINYLLNGGFGVVNSGGIHTTLPDLAQQTIRVLNSDSVYTLTNSESFPELDYVSPNSEIPTEFWSGNLTLEEQIRETALGI